MILSLERLGAQFAHVFALIAVGEFVFGEGARVVECFPAVWTLGPVRSRRH